MPKKQKIDTSPIDIHLSIDPTLKILPDGQRAMVVSFTARRGLVAQMRQVDVTNWKSDIPGTIDDLVRQMMGGFELPAFPNMVDVKAAGEAKTSEGDQADEAEEADGVVNELEPAAEAENVDEPQPDEEQPEETGGFAEGAHEDAYDQDNEPITADEQLGF